MTTASISLPKLFAEGNPVEWFQKYDSCCTANSWENKAKAKTLPTLFERKVLAMWLELSKAKQKSYKDAKAKIMGPMQFISMDNFHSCCLLPGESCLYMS